MSLFLLLSWLWVIDVVVFLLLLLLLPLLFRGYLLTWWHFDDKSGFSNMFKYSSLNFERVFDLFPVRFFALVLRPSCRS